ncbi:unnamed protein product [Clavelina lepadiformis]|uniref:Uncharacterized protein n=1 Tax=Clavelina lepadiformis TaxID=159417 RepID=A0ABP0FZP8_CLALP
MWVDEPASPPTTIILYPVPLDIPDEEIVYLVRSQRWGILRRFKFCSHKAFPQFHREYLQIDQLNEDLLPRQITINSQPVSVTLPGSPILKCAYCRSYRHRIQNCNKIKTHLPPRNNQPSLQTQRGVNGIHRSRTSTKTHHQPPRKDPPMTGLSAAPVSDTNIAYHQKFKQFSQNEKIFHPWKKIYNQLPLCTPHQPNSKPIPTAHQNPQSNYQYHLQILMVSKNVRTPSKKQNDLPHQSRRIQATFLYKMKRIASDNNKDSFFVKWAIHNIGTKLMKIYPNLFSNTVKHRPNPNKTWEKTLLSYNEICNNNNFQLEDSTPKLLYLLLLQKYQSPSLIHNQNREIIYWKNINLKQFSTWTPTLQLRCHSYLIAHQGFLWGSFDKKRDYLLLPNKKSGKPTANYASLVKMISTTNFSSARSPERSSHMCNLIYNFGFLQALL